MKIHIVQKGDTLWEIAKKYGVDFEQLKQLNSQLSSPDMIMPGMKIKIPSSSKPVKKETKKVVKETKKETVKEKPIVQQPYKDVSPKPIMVIKEDDVKETKEVKVEKPIFQVPTMPILDYSLPEIPKEKPVQVPKEQQKKEVKKPTPKPIPKPKMPPKEEQVPPQEMPSPEEVLPEFAPPQMVPMMPVCHYVHPCCYHMCHPCAHAGHMHGAMMHHPCPHHMHPHFMMPHPVGGVVENQLPPMQIPQGDCGCGGPSAQDFQMGYQVPDQSAPSHFYEQENIQPNTFPYPMTPSNPTYNLYPTPPVLGGPPSFNDLNMRVDEDDQKSEE